MVDAPELRTGWVYRSDTATAPVVVPEPPPVVAARPQPPRIERPSVQAPAESERGWIATGFYVMTLPITIAVEIMFAPVNWLMGSGRRD